jgi:phenylacetate-CoA ligase
MFIFRAVNIYPGQIDHVLSQIPYVGSEYQVHLHHREDGRDVMLIRVERIEGESPDSDRELAERIVNEIRSQILVRPRVELVDYGTLPRTERKSRRVFDQRTS